MQVTLPRSHGIRVHLTHVPAAIRLLHLSDVQIPAAVVVVRQHDARILCDDVVVDAEDGLRVDAHPSDLERRRMQLATSNYRSMELRLNLSP